MKGDDIDVMFIGDILSILLQFFLEVQVFFIFFEIEEMFYWVFLDLFLIQGEIQFMCLDVIVLEDCFCQDISLDVVIGLVEIFLVDVKICNMDGRFQDFFGQSEEIL